MKLFHSISTNPHFNLALEEYLFEQFDEEFLILYRNESSVIMGKHQNAVAEGNVPYLTENNIPFLRRFSGGGTVYHDINNINFSFITTGADTKVIDFKKYALPVIDFLKSQGLSANLSERNDILLDEKKISGHAAHAKNKRALHHGTLLYNSNLEELSTCLKSNKDKFKSRAVKSVRSNVCNIFPLLKSQKDIEAFMLPMIAYLFERFQITGVLKLSESDRVSIASLVESKYKTWEWNVGYSPNYSFSIEEMLSDEKIKVTFEVKKGVITNVDTKASNSFERSCLELLGAKHDYKELKRKLSEKSKNDREYILKLLF